MSILQCMTRSRVDLAETRKAQGLSQAELAEVVGVSQATISRLEKEEYEPSLQLLAKIAKALDLELRDVVPAGELAALLGQRGLEQFYCFCPNPLCDGNEILKKDGNAKVLWRSGAFYPTDRFEEVNFCTRCGEELAKDCPGCGRRLEDKGSRFCISCGTEIVGRPTEDEWQEITAILSKREMENDDIPF